MMHRSRCHHGEQLGSYDSPGQRRHLKKVAKRKERREVARLLEEAPKKRRYSGWWD